ncbi:hypothetical protein [Tenacibaculum ovolyticum]|uniref:hypothetical protein n=1 Tax=Tenacibaculum ovolyticum TaxID=104270 RepID=UPI000428A92D|nr:hypothetical protein [Tenacibaculum ovolyticum]
MNIKIIYTFFLLIYFAGFSQSELYVLNSSTEGYSSRYDNSWYSLSYYKGKYNLVDTSVDIKLDYIHFYNDDPSNDCGGPCGQYLDHCDGIEFFNNIIFFDKIEVEAEIEPFSCLPLSYHAVLLPKIKAPIDRRCEKQELFLQHSDGVNHDIKGIVWEYMNASNRWETLPNFQDRYPLNVSLLEVFGNDWRNQFTGNLQLRFKFTAPFTSEVIYSIQNYTIQLTECSPGLVGIPIPQKTTCNYKEDGGFTFTIDRDLAPNEKLIATLYYEFLPNNYDIPQNGQEEITSLVDNLNRTYSYTWKGKLPSGKFKLKYQTLKGTGTISPTDPSWASLEFPKPDNPFIILPAEKVNFTATKFSNETCVGAKNGKIKLDITSGETSKYKYIIYEVNGTSVTLYRNWTTFTGPTTIIDNLEKKTEYRIKVQDTKKCFARK